jgi:hypothetical protein
MNRHGWEWWSLQRQPFDNLPHFRGNRPPGASILPRFAGQCNKAKLSVLRHPPLGRPKGNSSLICDRAQGALFCQMRFDKVKSRKRSLSLVCRQLCESLHA